MRQFTLIREPFTSSAGGLPPPKSHMPTVQHKHHPVYSRNIISLQSWLWHCNKLHLTVSYKIIGLFHPLAFFKIVLYSSIPSKLNLAADYV